MNKAFEKAIASARYFKNKGEIDMWHCIWHDGKPYDYHLYVEDGVSEVYIYDVDKINNEYKVNTDKTIHIHKFKPSKKSIKEYKITTESICTTQYIIEANSEEEARDIFLSGNYGVEIDREERDETIEDVTLEEKDNEDI